MSFIESVVCHVSLTTIPQSIFKLPDDEIEEENVDNGRPEWISLGCIGCCRKQVPLPQY